MWHIGQRTRTIKKRSTLSNYITNSTKSYFKWTVLFCLFVIYCIHCPVGRQTFINTNGNWKQLMWYTLISLSFHIVNNIKVIISWQTLTEIIDQVSWRRRINNVCTLLSIAHINIRFKTFKASNSGVQLVWPNI